MYALISLIIIIALSVLIVRIGTVALTMTGVSKEIASFQSLSAFSGAGFTTAEAEEMTSYPSRRYAVKTLMRLGSVGIVTTIASLVVSFADPTTRLSRLLVLLVVSVVIVILARSSHFQRLLTPLIKWGLNQVAELEIRDYTGLLHLHREYRVADLTVEPESWLANERIEDLALRKEEGVNILGIRREDGTYIGVPTGDDELKPGDTIVAYGQKERLQELSTRGESDEAAHQKAKDAYRRLLSFEQYLDPQQESSVAENRS